MRGIFSRLWVMTGLLLLGLPPSIAFAHDDGGERAVSWLEMAFGESMDASNPAQPIGSP